MLQLPEEEEKKGRRRKERKGLWPLLALAKAENGVVVKRELVPLLGSVINLDGLQLPVEFKAQLDKAEAAFMEQNTILEWLKGGSATLKDVYWKLVERMKRFVSFPWDERIYHVATCYAAATYFASVFPAFPQLVFTGSFGSGKTRAAKTVVYASRRGLATTFTSEASVYRLAESVGATLLVDDISGPGGKLLHLSYKKGLKVPRVEKGSGERLRLYLYETYCPVVVTGVELPPEVQLTRAIVVTMQKAPDPNPDGRDPEPEDFADLRHLLYLCELNQFTQVRRAWEELARRGRELGLEGRDFEIWGPLLAVAKLVGEEVFQAVLSFALENVERKKEELYGEEKEVLAGLEKLLLARAEELFRGELEKLWKGEGDWESRKEDLSPITAELEKGVLFSAADLLKAMKEVLARKPGEEGDEKPYTERHFEAKWSTQRVTRFLTSRFGELVPPEKRTKKRRYRRITLSAFLRLAERYGYEPDERLQKLSACLPLGDEVTRSDSPSRHPRHPNEVVKKDAQGSSDSENDTCVESLSKNDEGDATPGDKTMVKGGQPPEAATTPSQPQHGVGQPSREEGESPRSHVTLVTSGKRINEPLSGGKVLEGEEEGSESEAEMHGDVGDERGKHLASPCHLESEEFEDLVGRVLELHRAEGLGLWDAAKRVLPSGSPVVWHKLAVEAAKRVEVGA